MITLNIDYSEYCTLVQSLLSERQRSKALIKDECKGSLIYEIYEDDLKRIDAFLVKLRDCK